MKVSKIGLRARAAGALVVVYKTDAVPASSIPSRVRYYRPQIEAYLQGISDAASVACGVLLFLHPSGAVEESVV